jgi:hypothetical protein
LRCFAVEASSYSPRGRGPPKNRKTLRFIARNWEAAPYSNPPT